MKATLLIPPFPRKVTLPRKKIAGAIFMRSALTFRGRVAITVCRLCSCYRIFYFVRFRPFVLYHFPNYLCLFLSNDFPLFQPAQLPPSLAGNNHAIRRLTKPGNIYYNSFTIKSCDEEGRRIAVSESRRMVKAGKSSLYAPRFRADRLNPKGKLGRSVTAASAHRNCWIPRVADLSAI